MKKLLQFALTFLAAAIMLLALLGLSSALSPLLRAQNVNSRYDNILWTSSYVAGQTVLIPVPGATIQVCTYPANAVPCTNLATLYAGPTTLGGQANNPTTTDAQGNFGFWAAAGYYVYTVTNSLGQSAGPYAFTLGGSSGGGGGGALFPSSPGIVYSTSTTTAINASSAQLVSALNSGPTSTLVPSLLPLALQNGTTATTQTQGDNSAQVATDAFVLANTSLPCNSVANGVQFNNGGSFGCSAGFTYSSNTLTAPVINTGQVTSEILTLQEPGDSAVNIYASPTTVGMNMTIPATLPTSTVGTWVCGVASGSAYACQWGANSVVSSLTTTGSSGAATLTSGVLNIPQYSGGGSQQVIYASKISGVTTGVAVVPGSSATSTTDSASAINTAIASGNVDLEVDSGFALSTSLVLASNTTIHCTSPQYGFIMQTSANAPVIVNAHQNAPTTTSGTGGYLVSNITDQNITVKGCQLNANSTQAVTGNGLTGGVAHTTNPGTGLMVPATLFTAINGLRVENNEIYDGGVYGVAYSNVENFQIKWNYIHNPTPTVNEKFTDGIHCVGPCEYGKIIGNLIHAGDDSIALNADDVNRTGSGSGNQAASSLPGWKWGWVQHVQVAQNTFQAGDYGVRLNSGSELIDDIQITDTQGTLCGNTFVYGPQPPGGTGNIGSVHVSGWNVPTTGTCNTFGVPYNFELAATYSALTIDGLQYTNPTVTWPILTQTLAGGVLSLRNWDVTTASSTFSDLVVTNGAPSSIAASGINWNDSVGSGNVFAGSANPAKLTCSNYSGPNLLLASSYAPAIKNGDCFTNTYGSAGTVTYMNTTFNEGGASAQLTGTAPGVCTTCSGNWAATNSANPGTHFVYSGSSSISNSTADGSIYSVVNVGQTNYTFRATVSVCASTNICQFTVRSTDSNNYIEIEMSSSGTDIYDVVSGSPTRIGSNIAGTTFAGNYTVVVNGTAFSITTPNGSTSGTTANTGQRVGMDFYSGSGPFTLTAMSVKSN